jgi:ribosomal protein L11 methyltransferase
MMMTAQADHDQPLGHNMDAPGSPGALYIISAYLPGHIAEESMHVLDRLFGENTLAFCCDGAKQGDQWYVEWLVDFTPDWDQCRSEIESKCLETGLISNRDELTDPGIADVPERNWLEYSYQQFPPFTVGNFHIRGSHHREQVPPEGYTPMIIDAATAFGSGEHGTTKGCLLLLEQIVDKGFQPQNILDVGTGSGILAIAAWLRFGVTVIAGDYDREALRVTGNHMRENAIPDTAITRVESDGAGAEEITQNGPFDLIMANILAGPLKNMAPDLADQLADGGYLMLSGILNEQAGDVIGVYRAQGLREQARHQLNGWTSVMLHKT